MKAPYYLLLTAATLLTACGDKKKEGVTPEIDYSAPVAAPGYISYNRDGTVTTTPATAEYEAANSNHPLDWLTIKGLGATVIYAKSAGAGDDKYLMYKLLIGGDYSNTSDLPRSTLTKTSAGWSGTFAGDFTPMKSPVTYKLRSGTFTNIKE
jgi:hypothetical protein